MSLKLEGLTCPVCHAYLFEDDDVVFCPECGAPHHRECYQSLGRCALEALHGTDQQYDREKQIEKAETKAEETSNEPFTASGNEETVCCSMCRQRYDFTLDACPNCNTPNLEKFGEDFSGYDFLGGIPADYDIGEGVIADEAKRLVASNTPRYIRKFAFLSKSHKFSWNWLAFLFPNVWALARKMFPLGAISTALMIAASLLTVPFYSAVYNLSPIENTNYADAMQYIYDILPSLSRGALIAAAIGLVINLVIRFILAIFGDYIYKGYVIKTVKDIKKNSEDKDLDFRKRGGISFVWLVLGISITNYLPGIILNFFL